MGEEKQSGLKKIRSVGCNKDKRGNKIRERREVEKNMDRDIILSVVKREGREAKQKKQRVAEWRGKSFGVCEKKELVKK